MTRVNVIGLLQRPTVCVVGGGQRRRLLRSWFWFCFYFILKNDRPPRSPPLRSFFQPICKMASLLKTQEANVAKKKGKRKADDVDVDFSEEPKPKRNKQRVLLLSSRGVTYRMRHLMSDLEVLLPHAKKGAYSTRFTGSVARTNGALADSKLDSKNQLGLLPELADLHNCNNTLYFEARRHEDLYMWVAKTPNGPSIKLHVQNVHTMDELKMTGNCLKGSRGLLSFDKAFEETEWGRLTKELFTHVSGSAPSRSLLSVCLWTSGPLRYSVSLRWLGKRNPSSTMF